MSDRAPFPLGRLTSVTDALNQVTSYTYDELGNRLTQTDANQHTTSFTYDSLGRRLTRTLPMGQSEQYQYDSSGRLAARTDFNGKTTTYGYDDAGRLLSKTPDPSFNAQPVTFTYYPNGQRKTMTDATGTTTYTYDVIGNLMSKATPFGTINHGLDRMYGAGYGTGRLNEISTSVNDGDRFDYGYDQLGRLNLETHVKPRNRSFSAHPIQNTGEIISKIMSGLPYRICHTRYRCWVCRPREVTARLTAGCSIWCARGVLVQPQQLVGKKEFVGKLFRLLNLPLPRPAIRLILKNRPATQGGGGYPRIGGTERTLSDDRLQRQNGRSRIAAPVRCLSAVRLWCGRHHKLKCVVVGTRRA